MFHPRYLTCLQILLLTIIAGTSLSSQTQGCQSCLLPALHRHRHHHPATTALAVAWQRPQSTHSLVQSLLGLVTLKGLQQQPLVRSTAVAVGLVVTQRGLQQLILRAEEAAKKEQNEDSVDGDDDDDTEADSMPVSSAMVATIGVYKNFISPLLPPACRFLPTCSQYGVQAIEEFGPSKGVILTAWRIMRCSPLGGKGYDPPKWPPVSYTYSSY